MCEQWIRPLRWDTFEAPFRHIGDTSLPLGGAGLQKAFHLSEAGRDPGAVAYRHAVLSGSPVGLGPRGLRGRDYAGLLHLFVQ